MEPMHLQEALIEVPQLLMVPPPSVWVACPRSRTVQREIHLNEKERETRKRVVLIGLAINAPTVKKR